MLFELAERSLQGVAPEATLTRGSASDHGCGAIASFARLTFGFPTCHFVVGGLHRALLICSCAQTITRRYLVIYISQMCGLQGQEPSQACTCWGTK